jgi:hypothetical protein
MMAPMSRARKWIALAPLALMVSACSSQPADPKALPSWVAAYPGSTPQATGSAFLFQTKDPAEKVLDFYEGQLGRNGVHKEARGGGEYGGFLSAADESHSRNVMIEIRDDKGTSEVTITPVQKK